MMAIDNNNEKGPNMKSLKKGSLSLDFLVKSVLYSFFDFLFDLLHNT